MPGGSSRVEAVWSKLEGRVFFVYLKLHSVVQIAIELKEEL
jgi:hypothetical protein